MSGDRGGGSGGSGACGSGLESRATAAERGAAVAEGLPRLRPRPPESTTISFPNLASVGTAPWASGSAPAAAGCACWKPDSADCSPPATAVVFAGGERSCGAASPFATSRTMARLRSSAETRVRSAAASDAAASSVAIRRTASAARERCSGSSRISARHAKKLRARARTSEASAEAAAEACDSASVSRFNAAVRSASALTRFAVWPLSAERSVCARARRQHTKARHSASSGAPQAPSAARRWPRGRRWPPDAACSAQPHCARAAGAAAQPGKELGARVSTPAWLGRR
jgi:hypothetical protein